MNRLVMLYVSPGRDVAGMFISFIPSSFISSRAAWAAKQEGSVWEREAERLRGMLK